LDSGPISGRGLVRLFIPVTFLYASYGLALGFVQGGISPILVARGVPVELAGIAMALFLPMGLAFLWSPFIERWPLPILPKATGWIIAAQVFAGGLIYLIGSLEGASLGVLFGLGLCATIAMATMDVQLEGIVVRSVPEKLRPVAAAIKIGTFTLGAVLGGGVVVALFEKIGWFASFSAIATFVLFGASTVVALPASVLSAPSTPRVNCAKYLDVRILFDVWPLLH